MVLRDDSMVRHHIGQMHPDRRSCLTLFLNGLTDQAFFLLGAPIKFPPQNSLQSKIPHTIWHIEKFLAIFDGFFYLDNSWGKTLVAHPLVNSESCYARVLN